MNLATTTVSVKNSTNDRFIIARILLSITIAVMTYLTCRALGDDGLRVLCAVVGTAGWLYAGGAVISGRLVLAGARLAFATLAFVLAVRALGDPTYLPLGFALHGLYAAAPHFSRGTEQRDATLFSFWASFSGAMALLTAIAPPG